MMILASNSKYARHILTRYKAKLDDVVILQKWFLKQKKEAG